MNRRGLLLGAAGLLACPLCAAMSGRSARAAKDEAHWSYKEASGPSTWGNLDASYAACGTGTQQSPVDLSGAVRAQVDAGTIAWNPIALRSIVNNGHTIQVNTPGGGHMELDGLRYDLGQFHFHHMSEHRVEGKQFPMEVHFVHKAADSGRIAVVGVFLVDGPENPVLAPVWAALPEQEGEMSADASVDLRGLLPKSSAAFRYAGSLTTPPCSESVVWTVLKEPVSASTDQIAAFAKLFPNNFRPVQPLNRRFILFSG